MIFISRLSNLLSKNTLIAIAFATFALAGCGGGGGGNDSGDNPPPLSPPVAQDGALTTVKNTPASGTLIATDADNDSLVYSIVTNGSRGTAVITDTATGAYTYTPNLGEDGADTFTFKANDGTTDSNVATVSVQITNNAPPLSPPVAQDGALTTVKNTPASGTLIATDADNDSLVYSIVTNGSRGTAVITDTATGAYTYTPNLGEDGADSFTFKANDGTTDSNVATVSIQITNNAPVAQDGNLTVNQDTAGNDTLIATDADNDSLVYSIVTNGSRGTAVITDTATGAYTYTPNLGEDGADTFTFKANDGTTDSNVATVSIQITNNAPVAQDGNLTVNQDTAGNDTLIATDADNDSLVYSIVTDGSRGTALITDTATGDYTYTPNPGDNGADTFTFKANDGASDSNTATIAVTINAAPVAESGCVTTPQAETRSGQLMATDSDSNLLMFNLINTDGSDGAAGPITTDNGGTVTLTDQTTGAFDYVPASVGGRGSDSFSYQVSDPEGNVDSAAETVIVDIKIMPFGDSITSGLISGTPALPAAEDRVGYRKPLYDTLIGDEFTFDFVGSVTDLGVKLLADPETESYGGWTAQQLADGKLMDGTDGIIAWLTDNPADIVLVHAGTNGLSTPPFDTGGIGVKAILDNIDKWESNAGGNPVTVLLALIIDQNVNLSGQTNPDVTTLNDNILGIVADRPTDDIVVVDQHGALVYPDDLNDELHPNDTVDGGYDKMATTWFNELQTIIPKCPP